jgi:thiol-disulfide isomerase/thioredoxin
MKGYELDAPDKENEVLYNWVQAVDTLQVFKFNYPGLPKTYEDFFPFYEKFIPVMKKQHELVNSPNTRFNQLMNAYIDLYIENYAIKFLYTPRIKHPKEEDYPSFYNDFMTGDNFKSAIALDLPHGINTLRLHQQYKAMHTGSNFKPENYQAEMFKGIENDTLRGHMALEYNKKYKVYDENYLNFIEPLRKDIALSDYVSTEIDNHEVEIKTSSPGVQGYPFTYKDQNDKDVSFSDFKGKYVYIDAWATWCAPCKQQIPHIKQLEKDLHGKNIQFVSISLDKPKDHGKWKKFIKDNELTGVQLFSDNAFKTRIARDYKINTIPRFLLFDPEGKIIDAKAKRPSNPKLKEQLLELLK